jgi:lactoylglutathione lyase
MRIEHIAIWTHDLEKAKEFYVKYFGGKFGNKYENPAKGFSSYFLEFEDGARLELMRKETITEGQPYKVEQLGYAHMALSLGSKAAVDQLTARLEQDGYPVLDGPRTTGDGYYESVVVDCCGNRIELTV